jgi:WD40 repeat protein
MDRAITVWDLRQVSKPAMKIPDAHQAEVTAVAWHPGGAVIASGGADAAVRTWDLRGGGRAAGSFAGHAGAVAEMAFGPDGNQLASAGADGCLVQWRVG